MTNQDSSTWRVEDAGPQHLDQIRALFRAVFKQEMTEAHWQWKYGNGRGLGVIVLQGNELIAFFGGTERRVLFNGEPLVAMQCGDSMVAEAHRGILTRKGPFYLSVTSFLGKYVGAGLPYLLSYGFPNARAMRLAQRLELYDDVGSLLEVSWKPAEIRTVSFSEFDFNESAHRQTLERLWTSMASQFQDRAIGIRDFAYIKQRFHDNPSLRYRFHLISSPKNEDLGLLVTRDTDSGLLLVDMVAETGNLRQLVNFARYLAASHPAQRLYGWLTEVDFPLVAGTEATIENEPLRLPLGVYSPGLTADDARDKWFFLCGDSDFL
jgi:hypothetical protein